MRYGQKGGDGPNAGKTSTTYAVVLPDGRCVTKRAFGTFAQPVGFAYQHDGVWYVAAVGDSSQSNMQHYTQCTATTRAKPA